MEEKKDEEESTLNEGEAEIAIVRLFFASSCLILYIKSKYA